MKFAIQIPIKAAPSERVPGKNFRPLAGRPLFAWLISRLLELRTPAYLVDLFIDSEDPAVFARVQAEFPRAPLQFHLRDPWFATNEANGNHLLHQFALALPGYDAYAQAFVTAPLLQAASIDRALAMLESCTAVYTARQLTGFLWYQEKPLNQRLGAPAGLPRTQDASFVQETTGFYAIHRAELLTTGCRLGLTPSPCFVSAREALDLDTEEDFATAERLLP